METLCSLCAYFYFKIFFWQILNTVEFFMGWSKPRYLVARPLLEPEKKTRREMFIILLASQVVSFSSPWDPQPVNTGCMPQWRFVLEDKRNKSRNITYDWWSTMFWKLELASLLSSQFVLLQLVGFGASQAPVQTSCANLMTSDVNSYNFRVITIYLQI